MKLFFRILKIVAVLIITVAAILFTTSLFMQNRIAGFILKPLNRSISTKFEFESVRLSFLRKFPRASLDLKNVLVQSSPGLDKTGFTGISTDTLLAAKSVHIEFSMTDIYKGIYNIERIGVKEGILRLFTDKAGKVNYEIAIENAEEKDGNFTIDLNRISLTDLKTTYINLPAKLTIEGLIENGHLKSRIAGDEIDFTAVSSIQISNFRLYNTRITNTIAADIDIGLHSSDSGIVFNKSSFKIDDYSLVLKGSVSKDDMLDLSLTGENLDLPGIKKYFPEKFLEKISDYDPAGVLQVNSKIKGLLTRISYPLIEINFLLDNGSVTLENKVLNLNGISFTGFFTNGTEQIPKTSSLIINSFKGNLGSAQYSGSLFLCNFDSLNGTLQLKGKVIPSELKDFLRLKAITSSEGSIDLNLRVEGSFPRKEKYSFWDILDLNPHADLAFKSFSIGLRNNRIMVNKVNGDLVVTDSVVADNLHFEYNDHKFIVNGVFKDLPGWLAGRPVMLIASAGIRCDHLIPESLFPSLSPADSSSKREKAYSLPSDVILDLNFIVDTFGFRQFKAEKIIGSLSYKPRLVSFKTLKLNSLDGIISGNGFIVQNTDKSFNARGSFDLEKININSAFRSFNNFGQGFLKAENINGNLSGSLSLFIPVDSLLKTDIKSITAEGKYVLVNGALVNFAPVKKLSSFIELSELENISFEKLENDFFIRNNFLFVPQMDVKSSAADLSVNGKHGFDNDYEYHVRILLSEMLSRKIKKPKSNTTEFGAVKDDGLGRTSVLLKIEDKGKDIKVGYDIKAAGNQIKNDIRAERQTLKTILNEEYGWFKNDTVVNEKPSTGAPRFKISWEETDTVKVETEEPPEEKNVLKNLFKKIK